MSSSGRLLQILGVGFGLAVIIGNTIGGGILRTPGDVAAAVSTPAAFLAVWVAGGLYALLGACSIAELSVLLPRSGGQYVYAHRALGPYAGFVVGWTDWVSTCGSAAAVAILIAEYSAAFVPALGARPALLASVLVLALALVQWRGVRWGSELQNVTSLIKALAFVALVLACFLLPPSEPPLAASARPEARSWWLGLLVAFQAVLFTYDGWTGVIYFSEELRDPPRQAPRALFGGVISVMVIYLLVNVALLHLLPLDAIAGHPLAAGLAASLVFGANGDAVIRGLTILSMLASINAFHLMATRVLFAMSRDGLFAPAAVRVNEGGTPTVSLAIGTVVMIAFIGSGTFEQVVAVLAFFFVANYAVSFVSLFVLRLREPGLERRFSAPGYPWTTGAALVGSLLFLAAAIAGDPKNSAAALLVLALSYPAFRLQRALSGRTGSAGAGGLAR